MGVPELKVVLVRGKIKLMVPVIEAGGVGVILVIVGMRVTVGGVNGGVSGAALLSKITLVPIKGRMMAIINKIKIVIN